MHASIRVLHMLPDMQLGGGQVLLLRNIEALREIGVSSVVCSVWRDSGATMTPRFEAAGVPVVNLCLRRSALPLAVARLTREVRRRAIDVIHTNNTWWDRRFGVIAGRLCDVPVVNSFHSMLFDPRAALVERLDERHLRGGFSAGVAVSSAVLEAWAPTMQRLGIPQEATRLIRPGLDLSLFGRGDREARSRTRRELELSDEAPVLINVARVTDGKGHLELVEAMARIVRERPDARLLLVGDGNLHDDVDARVRALGLGAHVRMLGARDDVPRLMHASDVFVFTSRGEGFGLVVAEALASGLPVVAFELPVLPEILGAAGRTGVVVPQGDVGSLASEVLALLGDGPRHRAWSSNARARAVAEFSSERAARSLAGLYAEVLGRSGDLRREVSRDDAPRRAAQG